MQEIRSRKQPADFEEIDGKVVNEEDMDFEDPIVMTDACLWITNNSDDYTGNVVTIADLRELDAVRGKTHYSA